MIIDHHRGTTTDAVVLHSLDPCIFAADVVSRNSSPPVTSSFSPIYHRLASSFVVSICLSHCVYFPLPTFTHLAFSLSYRSVSGLNTEH